MNRSLPLPRLATCLQVAIAGSLLLANTARGAADAPASSPAAAPAPAPAASPAASAAPASTAPAEADAASASLPAPTPDPAAIKEVAGLKTADGLWAYIEKYGNFDDVQPDPALSPQEQVAAAQATVSSKISHLQPALTAFLQQYPADPRHYQAMLMRLLFLKETEHITNQESDRVLHEVAAAPDAPKEARHQAREALLEYAVQEADPSAGLTEPLEKELSSFERDFPDDKDAARLVTLRLRFLGEAGPDKVKAVLETLAKSPNVATAQAAQEQLALRTDPLKLKFTDTAGKEIDLTQLRGKVVLLDFWATWCVPCMMKLPEVLAVYKKFPAKDFQIIGISLDENRDMLAKVTKQKGMDWPEVNDPLGFDGKVPEEFAVGAIPAAWLLDRKGYAHPLPLDADLDAEIARLIAEK